MGPGYGRGPVRPWDPQPPEPQREPRPEAIAPWLQERLFDRRIVTLAGPVGPADADRVVASLLALDAAGTDPVRLHLNCPDGELTAVFALVDTIDAVEVPVHAVVTGEVGAAALGILAACERRTAYPHARFRLAEPAVGGLAGTADEVAAAAGRHLRALEDLVVRVAEACGRPRSRVEDDFGNGLTLDAAQAVEYGLVEGIGPG
jgi:ATP-dependent Clp protease protease subunit